MNINRHKTQYGNVCKPIKQHQRQKSRLTTPEEIEDVREKNHAK